MGRKIDLLSELSIRNFAIIEDCRLALGPGLNVLTGETGAGKSIVVGAMVALAGGRVRKEDLRSGAETVLEGRFSLRPEGAAAQQLAEQGYALEEGELLIRRILSSEGKGRIFLNGRLAPQGFLQQLGRELLDWSGQHEQQVLLQESNHLDFFDRGLGLWPQRQAYAARFEELQERHRQLQQCREEQRRLAEKKEHLEFQAREIDELHLKTGEEEELARRREKLLAGEKIRAAAAGIKSHIQEAEGALLPRARQLTQAVDQLARFEPALAGEAPKIGEFIFYLDDLSSRVQQLTRDLEGGENLLEEVEDRLHAVRRAQRKYGSVEAALAQREKIAAELASLSGLGGRIGELQEAVAALEKEVAKAGRQLSAARGQSQGKLETAMKKGLAELGMKDCRFQAALAPFAAAAGGIEIGGRVYRESGGDDLTFLLSPNPGEPLKRLSKIASGGELSRLLLTLKEILGGGAQSDGLAVFDEVDAGIGGAVAEQLGRKLAGLAEKRQVLCITHLPQIASLAGRHLCVHKTVRRGQTDVVIRELAGEERRREIARMLAGVEVGKEALAQAAAFLGGRR